MPHATCRNHRESPQAGIRGRAGSSALLRMDKRSSRVRGKRQSRSVTARARRHFLRIIGYEQPPFTPAPTSTLAARPTPEPAPASTSSSGSAEAEDERHDDDEPGTLRPKRSACLLRLARLAVHRLHEEISATEQASSPAVQAVYAKYMRAEEEVATSPLPRHLPGVYASPAGTEELDANPVVGTLGVPSALAPAPAPPQALAPAPAPASASASASASNDTDFVAFAEAEADAEAGAQADADADSVSCSLSTYVKADVQLAGRPTPTPEPAPTDRTSSASPPATEAVAVAEVVRAPSGSSTASAPPGPPGDEMSWFPAGWHTSFHPHPQPSTSASAFASTADGWCTSVREVWMVDGVARWVDTGARLTIDEQLSRQADGNLLMVDTQMSGEESQADRLTAEDGEDDMSATEADEIANDGEDDDDTTQMDEDGQASRAPAPSLAPLPAGGGRLGPLPAQSSRGTARAPPSDSPPFVSPWTSAPVQGGRRLSLKLTEVQRESYRRRRRPNEATHPSPRRRESYRRESYRW